jgi:hypothetical protein
MAAALAAACALLAAGAAQAAAITFTSSADFFAALSGASLTTETYEAATLDSLIADGGTLDGLAYDFPNGVQGRIDNLFNRFGNQSLAAQRPDAPQSFFFAGDRVVVTFPAPVRAFGIFFNVGISPAASLFATTSGGDTASTGGPSYDSATMYFAGLIADTAFGSVTFGGLPTITSGYNVDDLTYGLPGAAVPEPGTLALSALGAAAFLAARRRRRG